MIVHLLCSNVVFSASCCLSALFTQRTARKTVSSDATQYNSQSSGAPGMDHHLKCLEKLCRVCGTITTAHRVTYLCSEHTDGLRDGLKVNVLDDDPEIHPKKICNNYYRAITRRGSSVMIMQWEGHDDEGCQACNLYAQRAKGGRPKKRPRKLSTPRSPTSISSSCLSRVLHGG